MMSISKQLMPREERRLIWTDLEMSGLNPESDVVLEAAFIITDGNLKIMAEAEPWVIHQPDSVLDGMDAWNARTHGDSGLTERCRRSRLSAAEADADIVEFLRRHAPSGDSPMCGNTICQDRRFMARHLPASEKFFHYRNFDVSSFKIAFQMYAPERMRAKPPSRHRALDDIRDSIGEMRHYLDELWPGTVS